MLVRVYPRLAFSGAKHVSRVLAVLLALVSSTAVAGYVPRAEVEAAARAAAVEAKAYADRSALVAGLLQAQTRSVVEPLINEARMVALLARLREAPAPSPQARTAVEALRDYAVQTYTDPVDPEQRRLQVPAFAVAGAARAALHRWDSAAAKAAYADALARADLAALHAATDAAALEAVVREASDAQLQLLRAADLRPPRARRALFERLREPQLALALLRTPATPEGLQLIAGIDTVLDGPAAFAVLSDAALDDAYVSAARLAIGRLVPEHPASRAHLLATLGDGEGASSAAALSHRMDAQTLAALDEIVAGSGDGSRLRHALLALRLSGDAEARSVLARFAADETRPAALRDEVAAWLR
ncbi:MAG: hypothetical protein ACLGI7_00745 [Gammaproteobacteria bacterium]